MKDTGVSRRLDTLGRIVLPMELRRTLDLAAGDAVEVFVDNDQVVLRKYEPACTFCGSLENLDGFQGKKVCSSCQAALGHR